MIEKYGLFNHHDIDNTLVILFSDKHITGKKMNGEVTLLFNQEELIGYEIFNFIRYAKIKYSGIIFLPANPLVDVINSVLLNNNVEPINYKKESGYVVKIDENGKRRVFAKEGTFLRDGTLSKGVYCTYYDLFLQEDENASLIEIEEPIKEGTDFFRMEEK